MTTYREGSWENKVGIKLFGDGDIKYKTITLKPEENKHYKKLIEAIRKKFKHKYPGLSIIIQITVRL